MRRFLLCGMLTAAVTIGGLLLPGCKETPTTGAGPDTSDTLSVTPPEAGQGFQIVLGPFDVQPGEEVIKDFYRKIPLDAEKYVTLIQVKSTVGGRSLHIYKSSSVDVADHEETSFDPIDTQKWDLISAALQENVTWRLATASAFPLAAHQQMVFRMHYLNTGTTPIRAKMVINVWTTIEKQDVKYSVGVLQADNENIKIPAHTSATYCKVIAPFDRDIQIMVMAGAFNSHGKKLLMGHWNGTMLTDTMYLNSSWEKPAVMDLACGTTIKAGDSLAVITTYENPTGSEISFGPRLMSQERGSFYLYYSDAPADGRTVYDFKNGFLMESHPL